MAFDALGGDVDVASLIRARLCDESPLALYCLSLTCKQEQSTCESSLPELIVVGRGPRAAAYKHNFALWNHAPTQSVICNVPVEYVGICSYEGRHSFDLHLPADLRATLSIHMLTATHRGMIPMQLRRAYRATGSGAHLLGSIGARRRSLSPVACRFLAHSRGAEFVFAAMATPHDLPSTRASGPRDNNDEKLSCLEIRLQELSHVTFKTSRCDLDHWKRNGIPRYGDI